MLDSIQELGFKRVFLVVRKRFQTFKLAVGITQILYSMFMYLQIFKLFDGIKQHVISENNMLHFKSFKENYFMF